MPNSGIARQKSECCADSQCICVRHFETLQMGDQRSSFYEHVHAFNFWRTVHLHTDSAIQSTSRGLRIFAMAYHVKLRIRLRVQETLYICSKYFDRKITNSNLGQLKIGIILYIFRFWVPILEFRFCAATRHPIPVSDMSHTGIGQIPIRDVTPQTSGESRQ